MSWYSSLLTTTTNRINTIQKSILGSEADGDTEDDTHVCRVLRSYYTEKGRPFPPWLPPDPKAPPPPAPVYANPNAVGSRYGGLVAAGGPAGGGKLNSLWDNSQVTGNRQDPQSLRQGRGAPPPMRGSADGGAGMAQASRNPFAGGSRASDPREDIQARPLPSQRAGSYQAFGQPGPTPPGSAGSAVAAGGGGGARPGGTAQDRLKQRMWGGARTTSPSASGPFNPPAAQNPPPASSGNRYGGSNSGGGGGGDYEDRFAPGGMYDASGSSGGGGGYNRGGGGGSSDRPFMAANAPWASNEYEFAGGNNSGGGGGGRSGGGLPSGPRRGLPSGPRMR